MRKRVRDLEIGDRFYLNHMPSQGSVTLVEKTLKTGAWYELGVRWTAAPETPVWYLNPKPFGADRVTMDGTSPVYSVANDSAR